MTTPASPLVQIYAPDGTLGDIPYEHMHDALQAGGKIAVHIKAPDGTLGFVPGDRVEEALKAGGTRVPLDMSTPNQGTGFAAHYGGVLKQVPGGIANAVLGGLSPSEQISNAVKTATQTAQDEAAREREGRSLAYRVAAPLAQQVAPGLNPRAMEEAANQGDVGGVLGEAAGAGTVAAVPLIGEGVVKGAGAGREAVGGAIHTPEGELTPGAKATSQAVGSAVGTGVGAVAGHTIAGPFGGYAGGAAGGAAGYTLGPTLLEKIFPEPENLVEAREQANLFQAKAEDLMRRGREQDALDRKAAAQQRLSDRQAAQAAKNAPPPNPFPNAISTTPPTTSSLPRAPLPMAGELPKGNQTPFGQPQFVSKFSAPESTVTKPSVGITPGEGRPATWTNDVVKERAGWGDPDAIEQARLRGFGRVPLKYSTAEVSPKSVTRFDAQGNPISEGNDFAYRVRDAGEQGVPATSSHAHATTGLDEAQSYVQGREDAQGKPQEIGKIDLGKLTEGKDFVRVPRGEELPSWIRFLRPLLESEVEPVQP